MNQFMIRLHSVPEVEAFVAMSTGHNFPIRVSDGQHVVNACSFMQMFCLILSAPLTVTAECDSESFQRLVASAERFLAN